MLEQQFLLFGKAGRCPAGSAMRDALFEPGTVELKNRAGAQRRERPRADWATNVRAKALEVAGSLDELTRLLGDAPNAKVDWAIAVRSYCRDVRLDTLLRMPMRRLAPGY